MGLGRQEKSRPDVEDVAVLAGFTDTFHGSVVVRIWIEMNGYFKSVWEHAIIIMW